jgi:hypothetical protein
MMILGVGDVRDRVHKAHGLVEVAKLPLPHDAFAHRVQGPFGLQLLSQRSCFAQ